MTWNGADQVTPARCSSPSRMGSGSCWRPDPRARLRVSGCSDTIGSKNEWLGVTGASSTGSNTWVVPGVPAVRDGAQLDRAIVKVGRNPERLHRYRLHRLFLHRSPETTSRFPSTSNVLTSMTQAH